MTGIGYTSYITETIATSDKNAWQIAGDYLDTHYNREAALVAAVSDLANSTLPDVLIHDNIAFRAKEVLFFIATRPITRNEPNI